MCWRQPETWGQQMTGIGRGVPEKLTKPDVASADPKPPQKGPATPAQLLGEVMFLALKSPDHRGLTLAELESRLLPPLTLGQFRLWRVGGRPVGFASWAMAADQGSLPPFTTPSAADWRAGPFPVLVDLIAPFGGGEGFERDWREKVPSGKAEAGA
ncbi:hypothetical protein MTBLM5_190012 [Magnetospirillum sp. LM-5]|uniref:toxin-activating lysine-acyltransferase n=1 Tax=Magnetospirillum sp. LM-5 TaxID=2681466 RepID=UPI0013864790|nr:toxin-activating lysine-acyltransferase [Magnetospirillum sp. LM-5]CAA7616084.1 hypothetical protein MTBLM5_190012 [Magnetospirillum sp. LM-5]